MNVADILERAADLIEPEGAWTQGAFAVSATGERLNEQAPEAVCWCVAGAISRAAGSFYSGGASAARDHLRAIIQDTLPHWNDAPERTQAEVVSKLREAAAKARQLQRERRHG